LGTNLLTIVPARRSFGDAAPAARSRRQGREHLSSVRQHGAVTTVSSASVRRSPYIEAAETSASPSTPPDLGLLATLSGKVARGRFLDAAASAFPVRRARRRRRARRASTRSPCGRAVDVYIGGSWFAVGGRACLAALAPEIDRAR